MTSYLGKHLVSAAVFLGLILATHPAKADAPVMLLPNGCGTGNLAAYNIPNLSVDNQGRLCIGTGGTVVTGNASGTTGAVTGTLAAAQGKTTYICGFEVDAIGGTAAVGPITVAGLVGSSMVFQGSSSAAGGPVKTSPCIPASAQNAAITVSTTGQHYGRWDGYGGERE